MQDQVNLDDLDGDFVEAFRDQVKAKIVLNKAKEAFDEALKVNGMSEYWDYIKADEEYELSHLRYEDLRSTIIANINHNDCK